jgi:NitT/TauT family transport system ATP-binding protein
LALLEVKKIRKEFDLGTQGKFLLFEDISFALGENERFLSILSPFGAGKTTLLKIIAGLEPASSGQVLFNGNNYTKPDGKVVFLPENPTSFPWLNVKENIKLVSGNDNETDQIIKIIGLEGYEDHYPHNRSLGFRFRIALGRALALSPALILIDDSLKKIDQITKSELYEMLENVSHTRNIRFLMASTDISDAVQLSERILVMKKNPSVIAGEFLVTGRDKDSLLELIKSIEDIFQQSNSNRSINFTI